MQDYRLKLRQPLEIGAVYMRRDGSFRCVESVTSDNQIVNLVPYDITCTSPGAVSDGANVWKHNGVVFGCGDVENHHDIVARFEPGVSSALVDGETVVISDGTVVTGKVGSNAKWASLYRKGTTDDLITIVSKADGSAGPAGTRSVIGRVIPVEWDRPDDLNWIEWNGGDEPPVHVGQVYAYRDLRGKIGLGTEPDDCRWNADKNEVTSDQIRSYVVLNDDQIERPESLKQFNLTDLNDWPKDHKKIEIIRKSASRYSYESDQNSYESGRDLGTLSVELTRAKSDFTGNDVWVITVKLNELLDIEQWCESDDARAVSVFEDVCKRWKGIV